MIIFIAIALGIFGYSVFKAIKLVKYPMPKTINYPNEIKNFVYFIGAIAVSTVLIFVFLAMYQLYILSPGEWASLIFGSLIFGFTLPTFVLSFIIHYYGKEIDPTSDKVLFISMISSGIVFFIGLILLTNGIADHITYPLVNGLSFKDGFVNPSMGVKPNLAWYALCILSGAILVYFICDHRFYKEYGKHGILESTFFVAFPAGIVGARIGYVIGEWDHGGFASRVANGEWWSIFAVWEGGLTIISGALIGIIVGVAWFLWRNKKYSIWLAVDIIVPCILVAQAIGRWGNFFNAEVHGNLVDSSNWWFLPKIIMNNAQYSESGGWAPSGQIYVPLFYIEFLSNLTGYFLIRFALGKGLRKYLELGDLAASYIVWYGLTRVILEPTRYSAYNMGNDGYWSWMWSIIFVLGGVFLIMCNHVIRHIIRKIKKLPMIENVNIPFTITVGGIFAAIGLALTILGSLFMINGSQSNTIAFNKYNNGFIILVIGLSFLLLLVCVVIYSLQGKKQNEK
ncbi:MAG: prolipoprotein diacylglyceryl transferase [Bacilli bacterium]|nr:prolipoprotein diacylglyceryl transferase [Bacilli bacterium]